MSSMVPTKPLTEFNPKVQWWTNKEWLAEFDKYIAVDETHSQDHHRILDRRFTFQVFAKTVRHIQGSTAECGVFKGTSSALTCATLQGTYGGEFHYGFDSFCGLPEPGVNDGAWRKGQLAMPFERASEHLNEFASFCTLIPGWIPKSFEEVKDKRFRLVHIDVDLELPTRQSLDFFYPRAVPGCVFIFDDYGFHSCPGSRCAVDEFLTDKPETLIELTTGQAVFYKLDNVSDSFKT